MVSAISPNCTLVELKYRKLDELQTRHDSPNCTLVELKLEEIFAEYGIKNAGLDIINAPNCTLVELK